MFFGFLSLGLFILLLRRPGRLWLPGLLGVLFGCSFLLRPNNASVQASIVLTGILLQLFKHRSFLGATKQLFAAGVGFLVPVAGVSLYLVLKHAFQPFIEAAFIYNFSYAGRFDLGATVLSGFRYLGIPTDLALVGVASVIL